MNLCPIHIRILMDAFTGIHPPEHNKYELSEWAATLLNAGLIMRGVGLADDKWVTTEKGDVFVRAICALPLPVWAMPGSVI